jgi:hypothetical protein
MFIITGNRPVMDKFSNTEYQYDPSNPSGPNEKHIHMSYRHTCRETDVRHLKATFSDKVRFKTCKSIEVSR